MLQAELPRDARAPRLESPARGLRAHVGQEGNGLDSADWDMGLGVVQATTDDWGVEGGGTGAWFEIGVSRDAFVA